MANLGDIGRWIADNESLLSGLVALVVLLGLVLSPIGKGIRRLYARRAQARSPTPSSEPAALAHTAATDEPLLAVLAFDNLSNDPEMQFFSDGVSEEMIQRLSRGARLKVIGRTSSFQFRGERKADAARALNCSHVLDGSIRRAAERVRINAHLGLVEEAYRMSVNAKLGQNGTSDDIMGPDAYRTSLLFQAGMPELRNDPRFARLCARLGLVEFWMATGKWPDCVDDVPYDFKGECAKAQHIPKEDFGF